MIDRSLGLSHSTMVVAASQTQEPPLFVKLDFLALVWCEGGGQVVNSNPGFRTSLKKPMGDVTDATCMFLASLVAQL